MTKTYNSVQTINTIIKGKKPYKPEMYHTIKESYEYKIRDQRKLIETCKMLDNWFCLKTVYQEIDTYKKIRQKAWNNLHRN